MKQYIGFIRDHSGSMTPLARDAARDYNRNIKTIQESARTHNLDTIVSTVLCGVGPGPGRVEREIINSSVNSLMPIEEGSYRTDGGSTPLWDSVGELITVLLAAPDSKDLEVSFLAIIITDGLENASRIWTGRKLGDRIRELQATDRWTFTFRTPPGSRYAFTELGIPPGNILEWEQTQQGLRRSSEFTSSGISNYFSNRSKGVRSSSSFYTDLRDVTSGEVKRHLGDISRKIQIWDVDEVGQEIRSFVERVNGGHYLRGAAFYELNKPETVQDYKQIVILDKVSRKYYGGVEARNLLGLPDFGSVRIRPGDHGQFDVFVQSTSVNRKLMKGTKVVYWPDAVLST